jgi:hypothetical protein
MEEFCFLISITGLSGQYVKDEDDDDSNDDSKDDGSSIQNYE